MENNYAKHSNKNKISIHDPSGVIGTWRLKYFELKNLTSTQSYFPYGDNPKGLLLLNSSGFMSVTIMSGQRRPFVVASLFWSTEAERAHAAKTYFSYAGQWRIEGDKIYVHVLVSLLPNWEDKEHFRIFTVTSDELLLQTPIIREGNSEIQYEIFWERVKD